MLTSFIYLFHRSSAVEAGSCSASGRDGDVNDNNELSSGGDGGVDENIELSFGGSDINDNKIYHYHQKITQCFHLHHRLHH